MLKLTLKFINLNFVNKFVYEAASRRLSKVYVVCGLSQNHVIGQFSIVEKTLKILVYLDMLDLYALPQFDKKDVIFLYE